MGSWELDLSEGNEDKMYWSEMTREILEVDDDYDPSLSGGFEFHEPESKQRIQQAVDEALANGTPFDEELLITTAKGNQRWIRCIGNADFEEGRCVRLYGSFQDIHNRKIAELELAQRNTFIETIVDNLPIGIAVNQIDSGETILMNKQFSKIYGWPQEELADVDTFFEKVYPDDEYRQQIKSRVMANIESGDPERMSWNNIQITTKEGEERIVNGKNIPLYDQNRMISTVIDVTAQKEAEREKTEILERIGDAFFAVDEEWTVTYWNKQAEEVLGMPSSEIINKNLWDEFEEAVELDFYKQYHKAVDEQITVHFEEYYPPLEKWFEVSAYPSETGLSVYFRDATERKRNEERIRQVSERFEKVTEATNDAIWDFNVQEDDLFWGKGFETLFGYDQDTTDPDLEFLISLIHPEDRERVVADIEEYMQPGTKTNWYEEYRFKKADGTYAPVMDRAVFIRNDKGEATRVVGAMTDLTRQKKNEEALKQLNEELEKHARELAVSNAELEQFAYVASHDLQEPLRMVTSFLNRLEERYGDQLDEKAYQYIDFAVDGARRMRQIILDLLNYSRVGQLKFERKELCLDELLEEILKLEQRAVKECGATIEWNSLPRIKAAETPIQQVFQNLIGNAIKYRQPGTEPVIRIEGGENETHWKFSVSDNGIGIRQEFQENIFTIFQRLHTQDEYSGTGIGLAVSKKIVEKHGGQIWVESEEGEGSTFYFTIAKA
ncbi:MAG: PAS domain S-box protein [Balneolaceae bacterium]|nr:PAS domain S-box protein [Balneolaceae bacterium]